MPKNLLIIGCSHSNGSYYLNENNISICNPLLGWPRHILNKYDYNVDVISGGGWGITEFRYIIERLFIRKNKSFVQLDNELYKPPQDVDTNYILLDNTILENLPNYDKIILQLTSCGRSVIPASNGMIYQCRLNNYDQVNNFTDTCFFLGDDNNKRLRRFSICHPGKNNTKYKQNNIGTIQSLYNYLLAVSQSDSIHAEINMSSDLTLDQANFFLKFYHKTNLYHVENDINFLYVLDLLHNTLELKDKLLVFNWSLWNWKATEDLLKDVTLWGNSFKPTPSIIDILQNKSWYWYFKPKHYSFIEWLEDTYGRKKVIADWKVDNGYHLNDEGQQKLSEYLNPQLDNFLL